MPVWHLRDITSHSSLSLSSLLQLMMTRFGLVFFVETNACPLNAMANQFAVLVLVDIFVTLTFELVFPYLVRRMCSSQGTLFSLSVSLPRRPPMSVSASLIELVISVTYNRGRQIKRRIKSMANVPLLYSVAALSEPVLFSVDRSNSLNSFYRMNMWKWHTVNSLSFWVCRLCRSYRFSDLYVLHNTARSACLPTTLLSFSRALTTQTNWNWICDVIRMRCGAICRLVQSSNIGLIRFDYCVLRVNRNVLIIHIRMC
jgi:hypothetical protein